MMTPGSSTLFVPGDKSYAGQGAGRADRTGGRILKTSLSNEDEAKLQVALSAATS
jgi:uncharacterized membrane protein